MTIDLRDVELENGDHVVQFYEREVDLFEVVGQHLARAARALETSIVIASETHRQAFETELELAGIELIEARRAGRLVMLDAASTMTQFMVDGQVDRNAFRSVLESILDEAFEVGRSVHVYGEMVALLWDAGDVLAAIELESLWNELAEDRQFSLLCGYPSASVTGPEHAEALQQICHLHSSVVETTPCTDAPNSHLEPNEKTADFAAEPGAPGAARRFVRDHLRQWGYADEDLVDEVALAVSELATNAVVHAGTPFSVGIRAVPAQLVRLSVRDDGPIMPAIGSSSPAAQAESGLSLVAELASCWGVESTSDGKVVWAEFHLIPS
jgi:anti-sigma regulatory factor (Ser/Thr protein kinase)